MSELQASAVDFPYLEDDGTLTSKKVLMHKRRITAENLAGTAAAYVCQDCYEAFRKSKPTLSKWCLANFNWLGRHPPMFRNASLGHQLLLALGRVVSTKLHLSSKGVEVAGMYRSTSFREHQNATCSTKNRSLQVP